MDLNTVHLDLTTEEANRLLSLCLVSPGQLDQDAETALRKLALYIRGKDKASQDGHSEN